MRGGWIMYGWGSMMMVTGCVVWLSTIGSRGEENGWEGKRKIMNNGGSMKMVESLGLMEPFHNLKKIK